MTERVNADAAPSFRIGDQRNSRSEFSVLDVAIHGRHEGRGVRCARRLVCLFMEKCPTVCALPALLSCRDKDQRAERGKASHPAGKRAYSASTLAVPTCSAGEPTLTVTFPGVLVRTMATARPSKAWQRAEVY